MKHGSIGQALLELEAELAALDARRDRLTITVTNLRALVDSDNAAAAQRQPAKRKWGGDRPAPTRKLLAKARRIVAQKGVRAAQAATGLSYSTIYGRAVREKWTIAKAPDDDKKKGDS
jgi:hypothetical protein